MMKKKIYIMCCVLVLCFSSLLASLFAPMQFVSAVSIGVVGSYSNVLEDLRKDSTFDENDYPVIQDDYSLHVITIAESSDDELLLYVYQPNQSYGKYSASSINISQTIGEELSYYTYSLSPISYSGVFQKYVVLNFSLSSSDTRYYDISTIYRRFDEEIDSDLLSDDGNTIQQVAYNVSKRFYAKTVNGNVYYDEKDVDVVTITDKYVGMVRYEENVNPFTTLESYDSHFVAFSTDYKIDNLLEADVTYLLADQVRMITATEDSTTTYEGVQTYKYLTASQVGSWSQSGLFAKTYKWNRIESVADFLTDEDIEFTSDGYSQIAGKDWVLRFEETEYNTTVDTYAGYVLTSSQVVTEVTILRLKFETAGVIYNLGVVDNKSSGDGVPDGYGLSAWDSLWQRLKIFFAILLLILLVVVLAPILPTLFNMAWTIFKIIFKIVVWVITFPFKLIAKLFKGRKR